ncbi:phosphoenolpyruvate synthase [Ruicaihuangia caeni]|uniref:Phosphoenolpyruvate synthase n=1 Tax=Ruicaihuangia caeni TaxID=3042517 RepID=A0AAW6T655_9MICO|nr:phosphoenolpyruvate synthase [Klugiella sp. YN-L-19]MDI2097643.1 phosphoenolpyruvate synthase [Klugiella sp. YN-L-19]
MTKEYVVSFAAVGMGDIAAVGGKNASLGEMIRSLADAGIRVPDGFATTAAAYREFLKANGLEPFIRERIEQYHGGAVTLRGAGDAIRSAILESPFPDDVSAAVIAAYGALPVTAGEARATVAVRSSATAEDLPDASFAGQQETFLNVSGDDAVLEACRRSYASLFTDRAISYREVKGFDHLEVALSVGVQRMVRSDVGASGVMFSIETETGFPDVVVISGAWGLGETVVQGMVNPDKYMVFKPFLDDPSLVPIIEKTIGTKARKMVYAGEGMPGTRLADTSEQERRAFVLNDSEIVQLGRWGARIEAHYGKPMDMEWAKDGVSGELFLVQARPETVQARKSDAQFTVHHLASTGTVLATGAAVGDDIAVGQACVIATASDIERFRDGSVLITEMTDPDWVPIMTRAAGIITDRGGTTSHAAIISRELGIPAIVGTGDATSAVADGQTITLSCAEGDQGRVYDGELPYESETIELSQLPATRTAVMVNIATPATAFRWWRLPAAGVGLARMEFIIENEIRIHPMALAHPDRVSRDDDRRTIQELTEPYGDPAEFFVERLSLGIAKLAAPYSPHPVIVRLSDFKSNEYAQLVGGEDFELDEENPMIGFRGASRYYSERYRDGFELECRALKRVRDVIGFRNVIVMVPFCRSIAEADRVLGVMAENGLVRGEDGLEVYMMCEVPSNVILASEFASRFDGFSIGSNDLTQLVLGVDRDSQALAELFSERDEAVTRFIAQVIDDAHDAGIKVGICGQGPSDHPEFAEFLVARGIDSISLNPDSFAKTVTVIAEAERMRSASSAGLR